MQFKFSFLIPEETSLSYDEMTRDLANMPNATLPGLNRMLYYSKARFQRMFCVRGIGDIGLKPTGKILDKGIRNRNYNG